MNINHFPADVTNKRRLGSAPFGDLTEYTKVIGLSDLRTLLLTWDIDITKRHKEHSKNTQH
jgi:hypothetical protein